MCTPSYRKFASHIKNAMYKYFASKIYKKGQSQTNQIQHRAFYSILCLQKRSDKKVSDKSPETSNSFKQNDQRTCDKLSVKITLTKLTKSTTGFKWPVVVCPPDLTTPHLRQAWQRGWQQQQSAWPSWQQQQGRVKVKSLVLQDQLKLLCVQEAASLTCWIELSSSSPGWLLPRSQGILRTNIITGRTTQAGASNGFFDFYLMICTHWD